MRIIFAAAAGSMVALAGFAGVAQSSATIDLRWDDGEIEIDDSGPQVIQLNVFLTAGPTGSQGAGVSVDFSSIGEAALVINASTPRNTPTIGGPDTALPAYLETPQIRGSRVELINAMCFCDLGIGTGLVAGDSHRIGFVTFDLGMVSLVNGRYEITSDADGPSDGVLDGDGNEISGATTFNSAFLVVPEPAGLASLGGGIAMLALLYRRRRSSAER